MVISGSYEVAVKMMGDMNFLTSLLNFPKEQINDETVELLQPYFAAPDFNYESARKASGNVAGGWLGGFGRWGPHRWSERGPKQAGCLSCRVCPVMTTNTHLIS
jgi:hypothetical protein